MTPEGKRKVIDLLDCTGSGDVDTSLKRRAEDGKLKTLSGRVLDVSSLPANESGEYRIGIKRGYGWMPSTLSTRIKSKRKEKFEKIHRAQLNEITMRLDALNRKGARSPTGEPSSDPNVNLTGAEKELKEELTAQLEQCGQLMSSYSDPGPLYDIVAWISSVDGDWRVVVDTRDDDEVLAGRAVQPLRIYSQSGDFANFGEENMMNYSVNVWSGGDIVEVVTNAGSHGTHVAGIVGAYHPPGSLANAASSATGAAGATDVQGNPENGVAPGCQIIGLKIGDSRLGSMETGVGLVRALIAARERKVDIINISYGEPASMANSGRIAELVNEIVDSGVIFVASASNSGPCLTTTGSPGGTAFGAIPVAAVYTPSMMALQYSMRNSFESGYDKNVEVGPNGVAGKSPKPYNWSSRGPTQDGYFGPSIAAPGGAIAPVPNWTLQKNQLMNGTSMSSPNACGCITLILSALKNMGVQYDAWTVRLAVENSARKYELHDYTAMGHGMIQVASAYDYYMKHSEELKKRVRFQALVQSRSNARGIYLRHAILAEHEEMIFVEPKFAEGASSEDKIASDTKFEVRSTVDFVKVPKFFQVPHGGRSFKIQITPPQLPTGLSEDGTYFTGEIYGIDSANPDLGPRWRIPITIVRGVQVGVPTASGNGLSFSYNDLYCGPGEVYRKFYQIPQGVTFATIKVKTKDWPYARMTLVRSA